MTFDYSGLNAPPLPSAFKVLRAGVDFHVKHRASAREYTIEFMVGEHWLYAKSKMRPTDTKEFLMRSDSLHRVLICLGWIKLPKIGTGQHPASVWPSKRR